VAVPPRPLKFKDDVLVNDKITTGDKAIARMLLGGKAVVTVRERSALTITQVPGKATIDLEAGKIALAVAKEKMQPGESIEIRAANAVAGVRGTVVIAEVSSTAAQLGVPVTPVGTFWVLTGQVQAMLTNQPGSPVLVGAMQQFRAGVVTNIPPGQIAQIVQGLSLGRLPRTQGGDEQAKENAVNSGITQVGSFRGVASADTITAPPAPTTTMRTPILPGNRQDIAPRLPVVPVTLPTGCPSGSCAN
jgi:hypothetical protein